MLLFLEIAKSVLIPGCIDTYPLEALSLVRRGSGMTHLIPCDGFRGSPRIALLVLAEWLCTAMGCGGTAQSQSAPVAAQAEIKPAPPTPIAEKKAELGDDETWNPDWDRIVEEALPGDLLSPKRERAVKALCPLFKSMNDADKRAFWAYFFQALAGAEAGLKPTADVRHTEPQVPWWIPLPGKRCGRKDC